MDDVTKLPYPFKMYKVSAYFWNEVKESLFYIILTLAIGFIF